MHPKDISIQEFNYTLPEERIAAFPLSGRDQSKLLVCTKNNQTVDTYRNIAQYIPPGSLLVFNDTRVIEARILFPKTTGATIEIFCLEPHEQHGDITSAMLQTNKVWWKCMLGGASKWKPGLLLQKEIVFREQEIILYAKYIEKRSDCFIIELSWTPASFTFAEILHYAGLIPLPPYIKRKTELSDAERYQTVYARHNGSVAAPTAGLHFTANIFEQLQARDIQHIFVTLHVGAGTFKPVKGETLAQHHMHAEYITIHTSTIESLLANLEKNIIAVGTTALRTIESLYWLGVKIILQPGINPDLLVIHQWDAFELPLTTISPADALRSLMNWMKEYKVNVFTTKTALLIAPGYRFRIIKALVTNFHQPGSTLLLLVAALIGDKWKAMYHYAMDHNFRFLSYGDGCLLFDHAD